MIRSKSGSYSKNNQSSTNAAASDEPLCRDMVNRIMDGLYRIDAEGRFTFMNKTLREGLGIPEDQYFNRHFLDFVDPSYHDRARENFRRIMRGEDGMPYELKHTDQSGQSRVVEIHSMPIVEDGKVTGLWGIARDITKSKLAVHDLECLLSERTAELAALNKQLADELVKRENTELQLRKKEEDLHLKSAEIVELNAVLKTLLNLKDREKADFAEVILSNIRDFILPYVDRLKIQEDNSDHARHCLELVEQNLEKIVSPFARKLKLKYRNLTPKEIQIVAFITEGKSTKEIAKLLCLSVKTVEFHRENIRRKFGIKKQKINLRTFLQSSLVV